LESISAAQIPVFKNKIKIIDSALPLGDAAIIGAAALVAP
jgi:hypothetical protein